MKFLITTFESPLESGDGLATYMRHILEALKEYGHSAIVLASNHNVRNVRKTQIGLTELIEFNPMADPAFEQMGYWAALSYAFSNKIKEICQNGFQPDWIEFPDGFGLGYFSMQRRLTLEEPFANIPMLVTTHCPTSLIDEFDGKNVSKLPLAFTREMELFCLRAADRVIAPSNFHASYLRENWGLNNLHIDVIANPYFIAESQVPKGFPRPPTGAQDITYASVARVSHSKGAPNLAAGFDLYWKKGGQAKLHLYGSDVIGSDGKSTTEQLKLKYKQWIDSGLLAFKGAVDHATIMEAKQHTRALFHASHYESFAYAVVEHMATGGIVVAAKTGGQIELIEDRTNGFIFDQNDPEAICNTIKYIDKLTNEELSQIGDAARRTVAEKCNVKTYLERKTAALQERPPIRKKFPFVSGEQREFKADRKPNASGPLLSVVIPHFNLGDLVKETVRSVLRCDHPSFEIILVDDGSRHQGSVAAITEIEKWDKRIRVVRKQNSGVADTRNTGVKAASGKYVALLDADDLVEATYYRKATDILDRYTNVGFVGCWNNDFDDSGLIRTWPTFNPEMPRQLIYNTTNCAGIVVRRDCYLEFAQHDPKLKMFLDDWEATIALMCAGVRGVMIPHGLFNYRVRSGSLFREKRHLWDKNYAYIVAKHDKTYSKYASEIIQFLNTNGPNTEYHNPTFASHYDLYFTDMRLGHDRRLDKIARWYYKFTIGTRTGRKLRSTFHFIIEPTAKVSYFVVKSLMKVIPITKN